MDKHDLEDINNKTMKNKKIFEIYSIKKNNLLHQWLYQDVLKSLNESKDFFVYNHNLH